MKELNQELDKAKEAREDFERCKRRLQISIKTSRRKLKKWTGNMLSGDNPDITPTDGQKYVRQ